MDFKPEAENLPLFDFFPEDTQEVVDLIDLELVAGGAGARPTCTRGNYCQQTMM